MRALTDRDWQTVYTSTDQTIEQRVVGGVAEERVTWVRETPEKVISDLRTKVADLEDQATGKITKAQLTARLDAALATLSSAVENAVSKGDEIQAAREAVE